MQTLQAQSPHEDGLLEYLEEVSGFWGFRLLGFRFRGFRFFCIGFAVFGVLLFCRASGVPGGSVGVQGVDS